MQLLTYQTHLASEVQQLFTQVFTASEGEAEGKMVSHLVKELQEKTASKDLMGFVACEDGKVIGAVFFSRMWFGEFDKAFILSPMAIATTHQHQGLGQQLINFGMSELKQQGVELLLTYGDIHFYSKVGFEQVTEEVLKAPLKLSYPHGWLAQSLTSKQIVPMAATSKCVEALDHQAYW